MKYNNNEISVFAGIVNTLAEIIGRLKTYYGHLTIFWKRAYYKNKKMPRKQIKSRLLMIL
jgi:hypothetical protein